MRVAVYLFFLSLAGRQFSRCPASAQSRKDFPRERWLEMADSLMLALTLLMFLLMLGYVRACNSLR
jgi:hypothetical protein